MSRPIAVRERDWGGFCVVAGSGPSLTQEIAGLCRNVPVIAVNDAWRLFPFARILYACDNNWWAVHRGVSEFKGEKWSSHGDAFHNDKRDVARRYGLCLVRGRDEEGFSFDPRFIHYGQNSGFQAANFAGHCLGWGGRIALVGFDMRKVGGRRHFFGEHPETLRSTQRGYDLWPEIFRRAGLSLPTGIEIVNCTPESALTCFPKMNLRDALPAWARGKEMVDASL